MAEPAGVFGRMTMPDQASPSGGLPLLDVKDLAQRYTLPRESVFKPAGQVHALNGVTAQVMAGRSLGVVGESGSGKSTFARLVMALERPSSGSVSLHGPRPEPDAGRRTSPRPAGFPDGISGSLWIARSPSVDCAYRRRAAYSARANGPRHAAPARRGGAAASRAARCRHGQVSARILRRSAAAYRDRARADHAAEADRRRRAGQRARRVRAGSGT